MKTERKTEPIPLENKIILIFLRHGEQEIYGDPDSPLSKAGCVQVANYSSSLVNRFKNSSLPIEARIFYSSRERTKQTGLILQAEIESSIEDTPEIDLELTRFARWEPLQTADSLALLIQENVPTEEVFQTWISAKEEYLKSINCDSPQVIGEKFLKLIRRLETLSNCISDEKQVYMLLATHETTNFSLIRQFIPDYDEKIGHATPVEIRIGYSQEPSQLVLEESYYKLPT